MSLVKSIMLRFGYVRVARHPEQIAEVALSDESWVPPPPGSPPLAIPGLEAARPKRTAPPPPVNVVPPPVPRIEQPPEPPPQPPVDEDEDEWEWQLAVARARARAKEADDEWEWQLAMARARALAEEPAVEKRPTRSEVAANLKPKPEPATTTAKPKPATAKQSTQPKSASATPAKRPLSSYLAAARRGEPAAPPRRRLARGTDPHTADSPRRVPLVRAPRHKPAPTSLPSGLRSRGLRQMVSSTGRS